MYDEVRGYSSTGRNKPSSAWVSRRFESRGVMPFTPEQRLVLEGGGFRPPVGSNDSSGVISACFFRLFAMFFIKDWERRLPVSFVSGMS